MQLLLIAYITAKYYIQYYRSNCIERERVIVYTSADIYAYHCRIFLSEIRTEISLR